MGLDRVSAPEDSPKDPTASSVPTLVCTESVGLESVSEVLAAAPIVAVERPNDVAASSTMAGDARPRDVAASTDAAAAFITSVGLDNVSAADERSKDPTASSVPTLVCTESVGLESVSEVLAAAPIVAVERPNDVAASSTMAGDARPRDVAASTDAAAAFITSVGLDNVSAADERSRPTASSVPTLVCTESVGLESGARRWPLLPSEQSRGRTTWLHPAQWRGMKAQRRGCVHDAAAASSERGLTSKAAERGPRTPRHPAFPHWSAPRA